MKNIVWDIDGVIRDLHSEVCRRYTNRNFSEWYEKKDGRGLVDWVDFDVTILNTCPSTEYYETIKKYFPYPTLWSNQPTVEWMNHTISWLFRYFKGICISNKTPEQKYETLYSGDEKVWLVEDYPFYKDYSRIVLIDRPYNQEVAAPIRIKTSQELEKFILEEDT